MHPSKKRFVTTPTQSTPAQAQPSEQSALEKAFLAQSELLSAIVWQQQEQIKGLQATLDKIVTAKYDRPVLQPAVPLPADRMPDWAMNDQGDVVPNEIRAGIDALTAESDQDFLSAVRAN